jgi:hypothetical protein
MYKTKNKILNIFLWIFLVIWQLPQVLIGLLVLILFRNKEVYTNPYNHISVWKVNHKGLFGTACFSSGPIIFVTPNASDEILKHETGHSKQSVLTGWLFNLIISIPSICLFWYKRIKKKDKKWYYSYYPENWANKLGGVDTSKYL